MVKLAIIGMSYPVNKCAQECSFDKVAVSASRKSHLFWRWETKIMARRKERRTRMAEKDAGKVEDIVF
jgi:hypothetical protein